MDPPALVAVQPSLPFLVPLAGAALPFGHGGEARSAHPFERESMSRTGSEPRGLTADEREELLGTLQARFERNVKRHEGLEWVGIRAKLEADHGKLRTLHEMERTGGEPDVIGRDLRTGEYVFCDCSAESPIGRRSLCYDREALDSRKEAKPEDDAVGMAAAIGIELLTEEQYGELQKLGEFDTKTSSWLKTPPDVRKLGGALFGDRRYGRVFTYHNGAQSYYRARGFRGTLRV